SVTADSGTANTPRIRAVLGPCVPTVYEAMPPDAWPARQSTQTTSLGFALALTCSEVCRHEPVFLNCHQAGSVAAAVVMSIVNSFADTVGSGLSMTNDPTSRWVPTLVAHANARF